MKKVIIVFLTIVATASLQGQSLYGTGISPESALVRVIFTDVQSENIIEIGNALFSSAQREKSVQYHQVSPGMYFFEVGSEWVEFIAQSGKYFTLIIDGQRCLTYEDTEHTSPAKTQVYFYNLVKGEKATFHVTGKTDAVFRNIIPEKSAQIAINPLSIDFTITMENGRTLDLGKLPMTRGGSTSVILYSREDSLKVEIIKAVIAADQ